MKELKPVVPNSTTPFNFPPEGIGAVNWKGTGALAEGFPQVELLPEVLPAGCPDVAGCSVGCVVSLPELPRLGKKYRTPKKTAATIARVISKRENVVNRAMSVILLFSDWNVLICDSPSTGRYKIETNREIAGGKIDIL